MTKQIIALAVVVFAASVARAYDDLADGKPFAEASSRVLVALGGFSYEYEQASAHHDDDPPRLDSPAPQQSRAPKQAFDASSPGGRSALEILGELKNAQAVEAAQDPTRAMEIIKMKLKARHFCFDQNGNYAGLMIGSNCLAMEGGSIKFGDNCIQVAVDLAALRVEMDNGKSPFYKKPYSSRMELLKNMDGLGDTIRELQLKVGEAHLYAPVCGGQPL